MAAADGDEEYRSSGPPAADLPLAPLTPAHSGRGQSDDPAHLFTLTSALRIAAHQAAQDDLTRRSDSPVASSPSKSPEGPGSASVSGAIMGSVMIAPSPLRRDAVDGGQGGIGVSNGANAMGRYNGAELDQDTSLLGADTVGMGQLKNINLTSPSTKQTLYTFPSPPPDTSDLLSELEEWYSYVEVVQAIENKDAFLEFWPHATAFAESPKEVQLSFIEQLLSGLRSTVPDVRTSNAKHLSHIAQGTFSSSTSPEHHLHLIMSNVALLRSSGALKSIWEALKETSFRWESASALADQDASSWVGSESAQDRHNKQDRLDEINAEIILYLAILYFMVEVYRGDEEWAEELMALDPPMPILLFNLVAGLRERNAKGYPVKKLLLLLWKSLLCCLGGSKDIARAKKLVRDIEGLPSEDVTSAKNPHKLTTKVDPLDYLSFRNEITSKYPSYQPPYLANVPNLDSIAAAAAPTPIRPAFSYHVNANHEANMSSILGVNGTTHNNPIPGTPAPSPPPSPAPKPKKQQFQTDQTRPFVLPFSPANAGPKGKHRAVPQSIEEAGELYRSNMRISTELWQTWKLREEFIADESGILKAADLDRKNKADGDTRGRHARDHFDSLLSDRKDVASKLSQRMEALNIDDESDNEESGLNSPADLMDPLGMLKQMERKVKEEIDHEPDSKRKKILAQKKSSLGRLQNVEKLYRATLPQLQSAVIVLLKLLLATVTANSSANASGGNQDPTTDPYFVELTLEETDIMRHREITSKAVSAILILTLKWFKTSHVMKFQYLSQLLVDSNCLLLILKMFGLQEVSTTVRTKNDKPDHNFFKYCNDRINPSASGSPRPEDVMLEPKPPGLKPPSPKDGDESDEVELITDYSWRNFFSVINFVHILQKLTKRKTHRVLLLVQYKSSAILKRITKVSHPTLQQYVLKVIKSQVPYCGRKWRQSNMKVITAIYLNCRPDLRDEWLTGIDVDADVEDSLPHEQALRSMVRFFNTKHYGAFAPLLHRRSSSLNHPATEFGHIPPPSPSHNQYSQDDAFPPTRSVATFDYPPTSPSAEHPYKSGGLDQYDDFGTYDVDDLLDPSMDHDSDSLNPLTSQAVWDRLGDVLGTYDDISDSESVGSIGLLDHLRDDESSDGGLSDIDGYEDHDEEKTRNDWESISHRTISALEEERDAASSPIRSPRVRRRSSTGPVSPALRPVVLDRDDESTAAETGNLEGPAPAEPHAGPAVDEVELIWHE